MPLRLCCEGTDPVGLMVATTGNVVVDGDVWSESAVYIGDYKISMEDFAYMAAYVLTNTDLDPNDPRLKLVKFVQSMREIDGYNPNRKRLESTIPADLPVGSDEPS